MNPTRLKSWEDKAFIVDEVTRRILEMERAPGRAQSLEVLLNEAVLMERERLKREGRSPEIRNQLRFWNQINRELIGASESDRERLLRRIVHRYVAEIHSSFNPMIYGIVTRILPWILKFVLSRVSPARLASWGDRLNLDENVVITGSVDSIRRLSENATLILAPTHVSNLDSMLIGLTLHRTRLPPAMYGAGINLFTNPIISYLLTSLGGYKVDRRKKNSIYKNTLKQYTTLSLECGKHNLFFPGGTRNRRGDVDRHLKLGLMGCGLPAFTANLQHEKPKPDVFVVPMTLSYGLVLEARQLIEEHLREEGKNRFIRERSIFSRPVRLFRFWRNLQSLDSKIHVHLCDPLDLFGNAVDENGVSRDHNGRAVDRVKYLDVDGKPRTSPQRDQEYTRELGQAIANSYLRNNTALSTHVAAFATFEVLRKLHPQSDFYRFLRDTGPDFSAPLQEVLYAMEILLDKLRHLESGRGIHLEKALRYQTSQEVFDNALTHFDSYHDREVLRSENGKVWSLNLKLLYYYRNRLDHYPSITLWDQRFGI